MSLFLLSLFENFGPQALWNVLGRKSSQLFGKECSRSAIWMFFSLFIRLCVFLLGINSIIPNAIIFALPFWFQVTFLKSLYITLILFLYFLVIIKNFSIYERKYTFTSY